MIGDETRVVTASCAWLEVGGWTVKLEVDFCDVVATRGDERMYAGAKGRTSDPGLDVDTMYGQLLRRIPADGLNHRLGVVVPTSAVSAAMRVDQAVRDRLGITVFEVTDDDQVGVVRGSPVEHRGDHYRGASTIRRMTWQRRGQVQDRERSQSLVRHGFPQIYDQGFETAYDDLRHAAKAEGKPAPTYSGVAWSCQAGVTEPSPGHAWSDFEMATGQSVNRITRQYTFTQSGSTDPQCE